MQISNYENIMFVLLLQKGVYPYEYIWMIWKNSMNQLPAKEDFYSLLNMEDITDADCMHAKRVSKDFEIKNLGKYYDLYVQSNILLLTDFFENFRNMCLEIYEFDSENFFQLLD